MINSDGPPGGDAGAVAGGAEDQLRRSPPAGADVASGAFGCPCSGLWGMTTSVIQQKGLPKDYFLHIQGDSLVSQK